MSNVKLFGFDHSPFFVAIQLALKALEVPVEIQRISSWDRTEILRLTEGAYYQVPLLLRGSTAVYESSTDSQDVARFVDQQWGRHRLFPMKGEGLQEILLNYLERVVEPVTFPPTDGFIEETIQDPVARGLFRRHKERLYGLGCLGQWRSEVAAYTKKFSQAVLPLEMQLQQSPFLLGDKPCYADFLFAGILSNFTYVRYRAIPCHLMQISKFADCLLNQGYRYSDCSIL